MKRLYGLIAGLFVLATAPASAQNTKTDTLGLTYTVTVPANTKDCFIVGDMNGWTPHEMKRVSATRYILTINEAARAHHYKYLSGPDFSFGETLAANRNYTAADTVKAWGKVWDPKSMQSIRVGSGTAKSFFFRSKIADSRNIRVWLPDGYNRNKKYNVLYMHDAQNLYDSLSTWNHQEWQVDEVMGQLIKEGKIKNTIVVGIDNNGSKRLAEIFPQQVIAGIAEPRRRELLKLMPGGPRADDYLKFIFTELKPYIDKHYSTYADARHTFMGGSSLGGMITLYALCRYPLQLSGGFCMSTHLVGVFTENSQIPDALLAYLNKHLPSPETHKIYFDHGTETLDALYGSAQLRVDSLMKTKGYSARNFKSLVFPGAAHNETDWAKRLDIPLVFLLGKP